MFSNLTQGSILYVLDTKDDYRVFTAPISNQPISKPIYKQNGYNSLPEMVVDLEAVVDGEKKEFKQVPSNTSIANFGSNAFVLADSKESLNSYIQSMLQNSKNVINSIEKHKTLVKNYESAYKQLNPNIVDNDTAIKEIRADVDGLKANVMELIDLIKSENNNTRKE